MELTRISSNVSRLDVQVTIFCGDNGPHLAQDAFLRLDAAQTIGEKPRNFSLTQTRPIGETLNLNKRVSDACGRLYDKAAESKLGPACSLWRYELELKRKLANFLAHRLASSERPEVIICDRVHQFFAGKNVQPAFILEIDELAAQRAIEPVKRDVRRWLRDCVSVSVRRLINEHGLPAVLSDLRIDHLVQPKE
jgi:DNA relaxase NicK